MMKTMTESKLSDVIQTMTVLSLTDAISTGAILQSCLCLSGQFTIAITPFNFRWLKTAITILWWTGVTA
jgi:hypothetical protein